jgi:hypothetical protein
MSNWGPTQLTVQHNHDRDVVLASSPDDKRQRAVGVTEPAVGMALAAPVSRDALAPVAPPSGATRLFQQLGAPHAGRTAADGFWQPNAAKGEVGLLEAFLRRRRTDGAIVDGDEFLLVHSRPQAELLRNFSNHRNERVDLTLDRFKLSKAALALHAMDAIDDAAAITGRAVKQGMKRQIPRLQEDSYFLVKYRDYSAFATAKFAAGARRDGSVLSLAPLYVEKHFAVRVGAGNGVFVPLEEQQFLRGWEMLDNQAVRPEGAAGSVAESEDRLFNTYALNRDQFRSLGPVPTALFLRPGAAASSRATAGVAADEIVDDDLEEPHPWDMRPSAFQRRWQRFLQRKYRDVGRVVVRGAVVVGCALLLRYSLRVNFGIGASAPPPPRRGMFGGRRQQATDEGLAVAMLTAASSVPRGMLEYALGGGSATE